MNRRDAFRWAVAIGLVLLVPIVPFIGLGEAFEIHVQQWVGESLDPIATAGLVVGVLASDILLPVPSSFVSTLAGARLGVIAGTVASWLGMTLGAVIGFALARIFGWVLAVRLSNADDLARMEGVSDCYGPMAIVLTRALPVLAEAVVLLMGTLRLPWRRFLAPVMLSNLGLALAYSALGHYAGLNDQLAVALAASIALPVLAAMITRALWPKRTSEQR